MTGEMSRAGDSPLRRAAERAAGRPFFLASLLLPYAAAEGLDDAGLAARLGCAPGDLARLLFCRRPREAPDFRADVERIAEAFGLEAGRLATVLREAAAVGAFRVAEPRAEYGWLAAARDREPEPERDPEPEDEG
jgi:hypothetical protein